LKASAGTKHTVVKGGEREDSLAGFLRDRLPARFGVATGEVVDLNGRAGPQLDILIYDRYADFSFSTGSQTILPAEALLASVEIKSKLTAAEVRKSVEGAKKLRKLRPHDRELAGHDINDHDDNKKRARFMHCVFAFETDLAASKWPKNEVVRFDAAQGSAHLIDAVYVLERGVVNFNYRKARLEDADGGAIMTFYFTILNFVVREANRRMPTPYGRYVTHGEKTWSDI
jgi:hypothetical protein